MAGTAYRALIPYLPRLTKQKGAGGYYEITVRRKEGGLVSCAIWDTWKEGTRVSATGPHGDFYVSPLRDTKEIVAIAGGAGITPFRSMMKQFAKEEPRLSVTLLYGCKDGDDVLFKKEIDTIVKEFSGALRGLIRTRIAEEIRTCGAVL